MNDRRMMSALAALALVVLVAVPAAAQQMFDACPGSKGLSAFLIKPTEGVDKLPEGWTRNAESSAANSQLAEENLSPAAKAGPLVTISYELPRADYDVALLSMGKGQARIKGTDKWIEVGSPKDKDNRYGWTRLGTAKDADRISVEVAPAEGSKAFRYAGLLAEGSKVVVLPVAKVVEKLKKGEPATICLIGDSVTENAKGFRGGSKNFDSGNPGLMKKYLQEKFTSEVSYISHREPPGWPDDAGAPGAKDDKGKETMKFDESKVKMVTIEGKKYRDGRVEYDAAKKIRLVNMGKGGAASNDAWKRMGETFTGDGDWRLTGSAWIDTDVPGAPPMLRNGVAHYKPDLVIINFGTNDANGSHPPEKWTVADYAFHMKVLATMAQKNFGAAVILSTPHKWTQGVHLNPHTQPDFTDAIRDYAAASGFALADIYNEYGPGEVDGIHPGDAGHKHIADAYMKALMGEKSQPRIKAAAAAADFKDNGDGTVTDARTGLMWTKDANLAAGAKTLDEALAFVKTMNGEKKLGHDDWRLATQEELLGLVDPANRPALPKGHPFANVQRYYITPSVAMEMRAGKFYWIVDLQHGLPYFAAGRAPVNGFVWPVRKAG